VAAIHGPIVTTSRVLYWFLLCM